MNSINKIAAFIAAVILVALPVVACAEATLTETSTIDPFTWQYLGTIAGASAFTLLVVQFFKVKLDKVWKIPTRVFAYFLALVTMLVATAFNGGLHMNSVMLCVANAFIAAFSAYGAYEVFVKKMEGGEA